MIYKAFLLTINFLPIAQIRVVAVTTKYYLEKYRDGLILFATPPRHDIEPTTINFLINCPGVSYPFLSTTFHFSHAHQPTLLRKLLILRSHNA